MSAWTSASSHRVLRSRIGVSVGVLAAASVIIFVTISLMFARLDGLQQGSETGVRETGLWAAFQADVEAARFLGTVMRTMREPTDEALQKLAQRYDVLYSRAKTIEQTVIGGPLGQDPQVVESGRGASLAIRNVAEIVDPLVGRYAAFRAALPELERFAAEVIEATRALSLNANNANNLARQSERDEIRATFRTTAGGVVILTLALAVTVSLLIVQLVHISRTGRELELLSERNARAAEAAEAGNKAKTTFLTTMSHEIRSPLNGIIGMTDVLAATDLSPLQAEQVAVIRQSGDLLLDVINDVLDFSKLESGHVDIVRAPFDLAEMIGQVRTVMAPRAEAKGLAFVVDAPEIEITGDAAQLRQVVVNFVSNAIKFTEAGTVRVEVRQREGERIAVAVEDDGIGIADDAIPRLFREFSQVDGSVTRRFGGTGLGLAICKRLIEAMGGTVGVESAPGRGSRFWFDVPAGPISASAPRAAVEPPVRAAGNGFTGRVLVVDDNAVNRKVAGGLLERAGLTVDYASDGEKALTMTEGRRYELVLMDMQMPVLDGLGATRAMRARGYGGPIVGLTANAFVSDREACLAAGMDDFMAKPVTWAKLGEKLRRWLPERATPESAAPECGGDAGEVDERHRAALTAELGVDLIAQLIADFAVESLAMVAHARTARAAGDEATVDALLHTIKGAGQTLGFVEIGRLAQALRTPTADAASFDRLEALVRATAPIEAPRLCA